MINRENYKLAKEFLEFQLKEANKKPVTVKRMDSYIRHALFCFDSVPFSEYQSLELPLPDYLSQPYSIIGKGYYGDPNKEYLADETVRKVILYFKALMEFAKEEKYPGYEDISLYRVKAMRRNPPMITAPKDHVYVSLEEAIYLATLDTPDTLAFRRRKFTAAWLFLSAQRAKAFATTSLKCLDFRDDQKFVHQDQFLGVQTKNSKNATTVLLDIPELFEVVQDWIEVLQNELSPDGLLFTPLKQEFNVSSMYEGEVGEHRGGKVSKHLGILYEYAKTADKNCPYDRKTAHAFRHGHAYYGLTRCKDMADYRAVSQNMMHENTSITDTYTAHNTEALGQHIGQLSSRNPNEKTDALPDDLRATLLSINNKIDNLAAKMAD